jgi:hypothetical protein
MTPKTSPTEPDLVGRGRLSGAIWFLSAVSNQYLDRLNRPMIAIATDISGRTVIYRLYVCGAAAI